MGGDARLRRVFLCAPAFAESLESTVTSRAERAVWLTAPILIAGLVHVAVITLDVAPELARPIDAGRRWRERPLLGRNKTWRGFVVMPAATAITIAAQQALAVRSRHLAGLAPLRRGAPPAWIVGAICGAAYVLAELPNSLVKRRLGIAPGTSAPRAPGAQYIVDQLDSVIGCAVAIRMLYRIDTADAAASALLGAGCHVAVERLMRILPRGRRARR
jgi:CDP-2,3-bis-(O-geranylgeranyl)-sn-glycerol synthase